MRWRTVVKTWTCSYEDYIELMKNEKQMIENIEKNDI